MIKLPLTSIAKKDAFSSCHELPSGGQMLSKAESVISRKTLSTSGSVGVVAEMVCIIAGPLVGSSCA